MTGAATLLPAVFSLLSLRSLSFDDAATTGTTGSLPLAGGGAFVPGDDSFRKSAHPIIAGRRQNRKIKIRSAPKTEQKQGWTNFSQRLIARHMGTCAGKSETNTEDADMGASPRAAAGTTDQKFGFDQMGGKAKAEKEVRLLLLGNTESWGLSYCPRVICFYKSLI